ncbi:hypothetical protein HRbin35_00541 [bacterium HR35]|nr:hypothetical protein HRbin35_00541 [bacterium HR35]
MNKNLIFGIIIGIILVGAIYSLVKTPFKESKLSGLEFVVYKTPTCGCCKEYIGYLKMNGANVKVNEVSDEELIKIKNQFGIPQGLWSCHTVLLGNYFIEGHVPIEAIQKLLTEKPDIDGIALPGMPSGSPGMPGFKIYPFKIHSVKNGEDKGIFMEI